MGKGRRTVCGPSRTDKTFIIMMLKMKAYQNVHGTPRIFPMFPEIKSQATLRPDGTSENSTCRQKEQGLVLEGSAGSVCRGELLPDHLGDGEPYQVPSEGSTTERRVAAVPDLVAVVSQQSTHSKREPTNSPMRTRQLATAAPPHCPLPAMSGFKSDCLEIAHKCWPGLHTAKMRFETKYSVGEGANWVATTKMKVDEMECYLEGFGMGSSKREAEAAAISHWVVQHNRHKALEEGMLAEGAMSIADIQGFAVVPGGPQAGVFVQDTHPWLDAVSGLYAAHAIMLSNKEARAYAEYASRAAVACGAHAVVHALGLGHNLWEKVCSKHNLIGGVTYLQMSDFLATHDLRASLGYFCIDAFLGGVQVEGDQLYAGIPNFRPRVVLTRHIAGAPVILFLPPAYDTEATPAHWIAMDATVIDPVPCEGEVRPLVTVRLLCNHNGARVCQQAWEMARASLHHRYVLQSNQVVSDLSAALATRVVLTPQQLFEDGVLSLEDAEDMRRDLIDAEEETAWANLLRVAWDQGPEPMLLAKRLVHNPIKVFPLAGLPYDWYFVGAMPPLQDIPLAHWCGAGASCADDPNIRDAFGHTVCNCRRLVRGKCRHYYTKLLLAWVWWFVCSSARCLLLLLASVYKARTTKPTMPRRSAALQPGLIWLLRAKAAARLGLDPPAPTFVALGATPIDWQAMPEYLCDVVIWSLSMTRSLFMPVSNWALRASLKYTNFLANQRWPKAVHTVYTNEPLNDYYMVCVERPGWESYVTTTTPGALRADADLVVGLEMRAIEEEDGVIKAPINPSGHRVATCVGAWPVNSGFHHKTICLVDDTLHAHPADARVEFLMPDRRPMPSDEVPPFIIPALMLLAAAILGLVLLADDLWPAGAPCELDAGKQFLKLNFFVRWALAPIVMLIALPLWPIAHETCWYRWIMFVYGFEHFHFAERMMRAVASTLLIIASQLLFQEVVLRVASHLLSERVEWTPKFDKHTRWWVALLAVQLTLATIEFTFAALTGDDGAESLLAALGIDLSNPLDAVRAVMQLTEWVLTATLFFAWTTTRRHWNRVPTKWMLPLVLKTLRLNQPFVVMQKVHAMMGPWLKDPHELVEKMRSIVVQDFHTSEWLDQRKGTYLEGHGPTKKIDSEQIEALCLTFCPAGTGALPAFALRSTAKQLRVLRLEWNEAENRYDKVYQTKTCARPGCGKPRHNKRWPHGLCPACAADYSTARPTGPAADYCKGQLFSRDVYPGLVAIPEIDLPLPTGIEVEDEVVFFEQPGPLGPHSKSCPLWSARNKATAKTSRCNCWRQRAEAGDPRPGKVGAIGVGFLVGGAPPFVFKKGNDANLRAVAARVARKRPAQPEKGLWAFMTCLLDFFLPHWGAVKVAPLTEAEWVNSFEPARRRVLAERMDSWHKVGRHVCDSYWRFRLFTKREFNCRSGPGDGAALSILQPIIAAKPRSILPPFAANENPDVGHLVAGPCLKALTTAVKHYWNWENHIFYAATSPDDLDAWLRANQHASCWVWCDYTMFDCTHNDETWSFIEPLYHQALSVDAVNTQYFQECLRGWRRPRGKAKIKENGLIKTIIFIGIAMNASGRDDTALVNVLLNGFAMFAALAACHYNIDVRQLTIAQLHAASDCFRLAVVGDDSLAACPEATIDGLHWASNAARMRLSNCVARFGFKAKVGSSPRIVDAVFLGCRPYRAAGDWWWGPTLGRRLYKHHVCLNTAANPIAWLNGVAEMEALCFGFVPIIGAMARRTKLLLAGRKRTDYKVDPGQVDWSTRRAPAQPDDETFRKCAWAYTNAHGVVTPEQLVAIEERIGLVQELPVIMSGLEHFIVSDDL